MTVKHFKAITFNIRLKTFLYKPSLAFFKPEHQSVLSCKSSNHCWTDKANYVDFLKGFIWLTKIMGCPSICLFFWVMMAENYRSSPQQHFPAPPGGSWGVPSADGINNPSSEFWVYHEVSSQMDMKTSKGRSPGGLAPFNAVVPGVGTLMWWTGLCVPLILGAVSGSGSREGPDWCSHFWAWLPHLDWGNQVGPYWSQTWEGSSRLVAKPVAMGPGQP